jgi:glycosyltransferase involved in cell wall biosynthesis
MRVSIVIPAFNAEGFLQSTIESVLAQTFDDWECVIVDDGSSDETYQIAVNAAQNDQRFRAFTKPNSGASNTRNRGFEESNLSSDFVIFLDHDDRWMPDCLELLITGLEPDPSSVACHGLAFAVESGAPEKERKIKNAERKEASSDGSSIVAPTNPTTRSALVWDNCITTTGLILFKRESLEKAGLFDQAVFPLDDWDLYFRMSKLGHFAFVNNPVIEWHVHETNTSQNQAWMDWATCKVRQRMLTDESLSEIERDCVKKRLARAIRSGYRHRAANSKNAVSSVVDYLRYLWLSLFWNDNLLTIPVPDWYNST